MLPFLIAPRDSLNNTVNGVTIKKGSPSQPVRIIGFKSLPKAGEPIICVASEEVADQITERREALLAANQSTRTSTQDKAEMQVMGASAKRAAFLEAAYEKYGQNNELNEAYSDSRNYQGGWGREFGRAAGRLVGLRRGVDCGPRD